MIPINEKLISIDVVVETAEEAIEAAGLLLANEGIVEERYIDAMIKGFHDVGPYIVLAPQIAIPHARPEHGVLKQGVSIVRLKEPVVFGHPTNDPVSLVCAICGTDNESHIGMLQALSAVLGNKDKFDLIMKADTCVEILNTMN